MASVSWATRIEIPVDRCNQALRPFDEFEQVLRRDFAANAFD